MREKTERPLANSSNYFGTHCLEPSGVPDSLPALQPPFRVIGRSKQPSTRVLAGRLSRPRPDADHELTSACGTFSDTPLVTSHISSSTRVLTIGVTPSMHTAYRDGDRPRISSHSGTSGGRIAVGALAPCPVRTPAPGRSSLLPVTASLRRRAPPPHRAAPSRSGATPGLVLQP
jgi:hypothetical protein